MKYRVVRVGQLDCGDYPEHYVVFAPTPVEAAEKWVHRDGEKPDEDEPNHEFPIWIKDGFNRVHKLQVTVTPLFGIDVEYLFSDLVEEPVSAQRND